MAASTSTRPERTDAVTVIFYAIASIVIVGVATWLRVVQTFRADGIAWVVPIDEMPIEGTADSGGTAIRGIAQEVLIVAPDVNAVSIAAIVAAIAVWALSALLIIGCVLTLAANFLRARFFVAANVRALVATGWTLVAAPVVILLLETMGRNGVLSAVGIGAGEPTHPAEFWAILPVFGIGIAVGLIAVAFRRGIRTQQENATLKKDTEGLV
nr:hypothetical protein [uncultured Microbacterium sp.]